MALFLDTSAHEKCFPLGSCSMWLLRFQFCQVSWGFFRKEAGVGTDWAPERFQKCSWFLYSWSLIVTLLFVSLLLFPIERLDLFKVLLFSCFSAVCDLGENTNNSWLEKNTSLLCFISGHSGIFGDFFFFFTSVNKVCDNKKLM